MKRERTLSTLVVCGLLLTAAACGDDDATSSTEAPSTQAPSTDVPSTDVPSTDVPSTDVPSTDVPDSSQGALSPFCSAVLDVEEAVESEDPERIEQSFQSLEEFAPEDVADVVNRAVVEARRFLEAGGPPTDAFNSAYVSIAVYVSEDCAGFQTLEVVADDYLFGGLGGDIPAGPTVFFMENESGEEVHEMVLLRKNEGVTQSFEELLSMPEKKAMKLVSFAGATTALPGETGAKITELEPGEHIAICFIPEGTTPEVMDEMESGGSMPEGQPHFMKGMQVEFTVS